MKTIVNGLEKEYNGQLQVEFRNAFDEQSKKEIAAYGFDSHGMVIFSGSGEVAEKLNGHLLDEETIREAVKKVTG